ncbi:uncharacterized protein LOC127833711 [Dreissena polymorpha]|nr:uncharacterized protein LOC127833711 [Dreissena polymorpha]
MDCYLSRSIARTINAQDHHVLISDLLSLESACAISLRQKQLPYKVSATKQIWMEEAYRNVNIRLQSKLDDRERTHIDNTSEQMTANSNTVCSMTKLEGEVNVTIQIAWLTSAALMPCTFKQGKRTAESYATVTSLKDSESTPVMPVVLRNWLPKVRNTSMQKSNIKTTKTYYKEYSGDNYFQCFGDDSYYNYSEDEYEEQDDEYTDSEDDCCFDIDDAYSNVRHSSKTKFANILDDDTYNEFANWHSNKRFYYERNDDFRDRHVDVHYNDRENGYSNKTRYGDYYNRIENYEAIDEDDYDYEDYDLDHMFVKYIADTTSEDSFKSWESYSDEDMFGEHEEQYYFVRDYSLDEEAYEKPFEEDSDW